VFKDSRFIQRPSGVMSIPFKFTLAPPFPSNVNASLLGPRNMVSWGIITFKMVSGSVVVDPMFVIVITSKKVLGLGRTFNPFLLFPINFTSKSSSDSVRER